MQKSYISIPVENILYSCSGNTHRENEQFVQHHAITYIVDGEIHFINTEGRKVAGAGTIGFVKRNQLVKTIKVPPPGGEFKSISIFLHQDLLRRYSSEKGIQQTGWDRTEGIYELSHDPFVQGYFQSLQPYFECPDRMTPLLIELKTREILEVVLKIDQALKNALFSFGEPYKIDLEAFMMKNYMFNVSMDAFAKLAGRSRAAFKRDFEKVFNTSPGQWLKHKRLKEAHYLIKEKGMRPSEVFLEVGFENLSHFSSAFKVEFGINPSNLN